jgi:hypothetical protein
LIGCDYTDVGGSLDKYLIVGNQAVNLFNCAFKMTKVIEKSITPAFW